MPDCFVMMTYENPINSYYEGIIAPAIRAAGLDPVRSDDIFQPGSIINQIWSAIRGSSLCVAEVTGLNANVLYELGLAHALGKPVVQPVQGASQLPFDLRGFRHVTYDTQAVGWDAKLSSDIQRALHETMENPISARVFPDAPALAEEGGDPFRSESPDARRLVMDKPRGWEYLLTAELLRTRLGPLRRELIDLERGLIYRPTSMMDLAESITWFQRKLSDLRNIVAMLSVTTNEEMPASWGPPGEPGNALEILRAANQIRSAGQAMLDWELDVYFSHSPGRFDHIRELMRNWTRELLDELQKIPDAIADKFSEPYPTGVIAINLTIKAPTTLPEVLQELANLQNDFGS